MGLKIFFSYFWKMDHWDSLFNANVRGKKKSHLVNEKKKAVIDKRA